MSLAQRCLDMTDAVALTQREFYVIIRCPDRSVYLFRSCFYCYCLAPAAATFTYLSQSNHPPPLQLCSSAPPTPPYRCTRPPAHILRPRIQPAPLNTSRKYPTTAATRIRTLQSKHSNNHQSLYAEERMLLLSSMTQTVNEMSLDQRKD